MSNLWASITEVEVHPIMTRFVIFVCILFNPYLGSILKKKKKLFFFFIFNQTLFDKKKLHVIQIFLFYFLTIHSVTK